MNGYIDSYGIAKKIRCVRLKKGLTQLQMGELIGYSERQVRRLESEGTLNLGVINQIALAFDVSLKSILFDEDAF